MVLVNKRDISALSIGRLVPVKGFDDLLDAWAKVEIPLVIVGDGKERSRLTSQASLLGLSDRVTFLGHRGDIGALLSQSDLVVVSSRREGFSYVILEALRAKRVVVSTATGIAQDLLPDQYIARTRDSRNLASRINYVVANLDAAKKDFELVWQRAERMTIGKMLDELESVYRELLSDRWKSRT